MNGPLDGIRVIDTTIARSGPSCARQLADLGAEIGDDAPISAPGAR